MKTSGENVSQVSDPGKLRLLLTRIYLIDCEVSKLLDLILSSCFDNNKAENQNCYSFLTRC